MKTTYYLFDPVAAHFNELLKSKYTEGESRYEDITRAGIDIDFEYRVLIERNKSKRPGWTGFLRGYVDEEACNELSNVTNSFVVLIKIPHKGSERYFAITGGAGHAALNRDLIEQNFGLMTALNAIDPEQVKHFDAKSIDARSRQKRITASQASSLANIDFDTDADLMHAISGTVGTDMGEGKVTGSSSLSLQGNRTFSQLGEVCKTLLEHYESDRYKKYFGFINNIQIEKNKRTAGVLDDMLVNALRNRTTDTIISASYPAGFNHEECTIFKIGGNGPELSVPQVDMDALYGYFDEGGEIDLDALKQRIRIAGFDADETGSRKTSYSSLYNFLNFETTYQDRHYTLSHRRWYSIEKSYLEHIQVSLDEMLVNQAWSVAPWSRSQNPLEYVKNNYGIDEDYLVLDKPTIPGKEEPLDLFHLPTKRAFIVKKANHSSTLGEVFEKGSYSADLMRGNASYRTHLMAQLEKRWGQKDPAILRDISIVYAIGVPQKEMTVHDLPVLARINLMKHAKHLQKLGIPVQLTLIPLV